MECTFKIKVTGNIIPKSRALRNFQSDLHLKITILKSGNNSD